MFKSIVKNVGLAFSSLAAVLSVCQSASAQLNVGRYGVQPGLEYNYLQYQLSGQDLSQMRSIPGCVVGFGLSCNKTGSLLQQIVQSNNGPSYNDLLMRAAGGQNNFQNFANFYGNNPYLPEVPYASFWHNDSANVMDGYKYLLGQPVGRTPVEGLGSVTKNFYWSPLSQPNNSLSLRSGLLDLKYSYGRLLIEEAAKVPNLKEQIQSLGLPQNTTNYYLDTLSRGVRALNSGDEKQLQQSVLEVLSAPYSPENRGEYFGRPDIGIPGEFNQISGAVVPDVTPGDIVSDFNPTGLDGDAITLDIPSTAGDVVSAAGGSAFPWFALLPLLGLLALLGGGGSSSGSNGSGSTPGGGTTGGGDIPAGGLPGGGTGGGDIPGGGLPGGGSGGDIPGGGLPGGGIPGVIVPPGGGGEIITQKVPEPSVIHALVLLIIVMFILRRQQWFAKARN